MPLHPSVRPPSNSGTPGLPPQQLNPQHQQPPPTPPHPVLSKPFHRQNALAVPTMYTVRVAGGAAPSSSNQLYSCERGETFELFLLSANSDLYDRQLKQPSVLRRS